MFISLCYEDLKQSPSLIRFSLYSVPLHSLSPALYDPGSTRDVGCCNPPKPGYLVWIAPGDVLRQHSHLLLRERLLQMIHKDRELLQVQRQLRDLEKSRNAIADELVDLVSKNEALQARADELPKVQESLATAQQKLDNIMVMYGTCGRIRSYRCPQPRVWVYVLVSHVRVP